MKQLTNDIYRAKKKLELLESEGVGQLLMDFYNEIYLHPEQYIEDNIQVIINNLRKDYLNLMKDYTPSKQTKIEFHNG